MGPQGVMSPVGLREKVGALLRDGIAHGGGGGPKNAYFGTRRVRLVREKGGGRGAAFKNGGCAAGNAGREGAGLHG